MIEMRVVVCLQMIASQTTVKVPSSPVLHLRHPNRVLRFQRLAFYLSHSLTHSHHLGDSTNLLEEEEVSSAMMV